MRMTNTVNYISFKLTIRRNFRKHRNMTILPGRSSGTSMQTDNVTLKTQPCSEFVQFVLTNSWRLLRSFPIRYSPLMWHSTLPLCELLTVELEKNESSYCFAWLNTNIWRWRFTWTVFKDAVNTLPVSVIKTSQVLLYREIIAVCSQMHTKHINTVSGQKVELLNVKPGGAYINYYALNHGSPTRGPPTCISRPAATNLNCVSTIKILL